MNKTVIVTGIPGTGKTTVCTFIEKLARKAGVEISVITYGTVMIGILQKRGKTMERDAMRRDTLDSQHELQSEVAKAIAERMKQSKGITIIDTHMAIRTSAGYMPGLPRHVLELLKPQMLVLVEAQPREISLRRMKDASRKRDEATEDTVKEELLVSRLMAGACAVETGAPVKIVINAEGKQEEAAKGILRAIGAV